MDRETAKNEVVIAGILDLVDGQQFFSGVLDAGEYCLGRFAGITGFGIIGDQDVHASSLPRGIVADRQIKVQFGIQTFIGIFVSLIAAACSFYFWKKT